MTAVLRSLGSLTLRTTTMWNSSAYSGLSIRPLIPRLRGTARLEPYTLIWQAVIRGTRAPRRTIANANLDVSLAIVEGR